MLNKRTWIFPRFLSLTFAIWAENRSHAPLLWSRDRQQALANKRLTSNLSISPVRQRMNLRKKRRSGNELHSRMERVIYCCWQKKNKKTSQTRDKEIPFVRNSHSALFQRNQLTEQVGLWVSTEIMLLWWWWVKNMTNRILSLFDLGYLWDIQYGARRVAHNPKDRGCNTDTQCFC